MGAVQRYQKPLDDDHLEQMLTGGRWPVEPLPSPVASEAIESAIASVGQDVTGSELDGLLVEGVHRAMPISRREAADVRVWQWLCVENFSEFVWRRWGRGVPEPDALTHALTASMRERFLGKSSLRGISRNALARLWWTGEQLVENGDYELARKALSNQDMFQNIFERFFGIYPEAARACLRRFDGCSEAEVRTASKWLQQYATTTVLEGLDESQITAVLDEALAAHA